ncbi:MAG: four helix bundle protein [Bacteroidetes bacterium]|nr:four helix bundle protein [Bacteroidota bacterium]
MLFTKNQNSSIWNVRKIIQSIPYDKMVVDQLNRASLSIILNIAEGSGKFSNPDRKKFLLLPEHQFLNVLPFWIFFMMKIKLIPLSLKIN